MAFSSRGPAERAPGIPGQESSRGPHRRSSARVRHVRLGEIPRVNTGAGTSTIWDHGTYELLKWRAKKSWSCCTASGLIGRLRAIPHQREELDDPSDRIAAPRQDWQPMPDLIKPMLATPGEIPKSDARLGLRIQMGRIRAIVYVEGGRLYERSVATTRISWRSAFPSCATLGDCSARRIRRSTAKSWHLMARDDRISAACRTVFISALASRQRHGSSVGEPPGELPRV